MNRTTPLKGTPDMGAAGTLEIYKRHRFPVLDGMRGIAAILVVFYHSYYALFSRLFPNAFVAVDFFFILSGFVVCHAYGDRLLDGMKAAQYITRRIARLFPMMAVGLMLGTIVLIAANHVGRSEYSDSESLLGMISNLCFIPYFNAKKIFLTGGGYTQGLLFPADSPVWCVSFELAASIAFVWLVRMSQATLIKICITCLVLVFAIALYRGHLHGGPLEVDGGYNSDNFAIALPRVFYGFVIGVVLYRLRRVSSSIAWIDRLQKSSPPAVTWLYLALFATIIFPFRLGGFYYFISAMIVAPLLVIFGSKATFHSTKAQYLFDITAWISYPLYCLHEPLHRIIKGIMQQIGFDFARNEISLALVFALCVPIAMFINKYVQRQFTGYLISLCDRLSLQPIFFKVK